MSYATQVTNSMGEVVAMKRLKLAVLVALMVIPTATFAFEQIRDRSGNLIGTRTKVGDRFEYRDGSNNKIGESNREGSRTIMRDGSGNYIGEVDRGNGGGND
jgi:hypothetical protein